MKKENRWTLGTKNFVLPSLPPDMRGRHGCKLHRMTFDASIGEEICRLHGRTGVRGPIQRSPSLQPVCPYWSRPNAPWGGGVHPMADSCQSPQEVLIEQYLNPNH